LLFGQASSTDNQSPVTQETADANPAPVDIEALEKSWESMTARQFVDGVGKSVETAPDDNTKKRIRRSRTGEATRRLSDTNDATEADLESLHALAAWSKLRLNKKEQEALEAKLAGRADLPPSQLSGTDLDFKYHTLLKLVGPNDQLLIDWIDSHNLNEARIADLEWICMRLADGGAAKNRSLSVNWTGYIQPSSSGNYQFTANPLRLDLVDGDQVTQSTMKVWLDDALILDTSTDEKRSKPIALKAQKKAAIKVEFAHEHPGEKISRWNPPAAMLYWQADGGAKQLVPAAVLSSPDGSGSGLLGEYKYTPVGDNAKVIEHRRLDPQIDFFWAFGDSFAPREGKAPEYVQRLMSEIFSRYTQAEYRQTRIQDYQEGDRDIGICLHLAELMTSTQRAAVLSSFSDPEFLRHLYTSHMQDLYLAYRGGAEAEALNFAGEWMKQAPFGSQLTYRFARNNRKRFFDFADTIAYQYPEGQAVLEKRFLRLPDNQCCHWAAYSLAYIYASQNGLEKWVADLDSQLADQNLTGDTRATWLLARAQAEEIRSAEAIERGKTPVERLDAGSKYLEEAAESASSESVSLLVMRERLARFAADNHRDKAASILRNAMKQYSSPEAHNEFVQWRVELERAKTDAAKAKNYKAAATFQYLARMLPEPPAEVPSA